MSASAGSAGVIIYKAFTPTLKMALCMLAGFALAKAGGLSASNTRGVSLITMNVSLPCLIFTSMVSAFTKDNAGAFGPLILVAVIYQILGGLFAWIVTELVWVPTDFRWGILVMGVCSNWGNLPTAVVQTMAKDSPFNPEVDVNLGVAYIAVFILVFNTTFFGLGFHRLCAWDFDETHATANPQPFKVRWARRWAKLRKGAHLGLRQRDRGSSQDEEAAGWPSSSHAMDGHQSGVSDSTTPTLPSEGVTGVTNDEKQLRPMTSLSEKNPTGQTSSFNRSGSALRRHKSHTHSFIERMETTRRISAIAPLEGGPMEASTILRSTGLNGIEDSPFVEEEEDEISNRLASNDLDGSNATTLTAGHHSPMPETHRTTRQKATRVFKKILSETPPATWATVVGLPFSLVDPLKALLTDVPGWTGGRMPNAPDDNPPLHWVLDAANFLGAITIPAALVLLGASFARLKIPKKWGDLPIVAILSMTCVKMILIPVIAVFMVQGIQNTTSLFPPADKIRTFVAILLSGTPAAANQLVITQLYNPEGTADTLASFLLAQYVAMFVLSTGLAAVALYIVE